LRIDSDIKNQQKLHSGHRTGVSNSNCTEGQMRTYKVNWGAQPALGLPKGCIMTMTQQWQYLNLTGNSFNILFPAKGIMSYRKIICSLLYVRLKGTYSFASRTLW